MPYYDKGGGGGGLPLAPPPNPLFVLLNLAVNWLYQIAQPVVARNTTSPNPSTNSSGGNNGSGQSSTTGTQQQNSSSSSAPSEDDELRIAQRRLEAQRAEENRRKWLEANEIGRDFFQRFTPSGLGFVNPDPNPIFYQRDDSSQFFPFTPSNNPVADLLNRRNNQPPFPPPFPFSFEFNTEQRYIPQQNTLSLNELFGAQWTRTQTPVNPLLVGVIDLAPAPIQPALFAMGLEGFGPPIAMPTDFNRLVTVNLGQTVDPEDPAIIAANTQYQTLVQSTSQQTPSSNQGGANPHDWLLLLAALALTAAANVARIALDPNLGRWIEDLLRGGFSLLDQERQTFDDFPLDPNLNSNQILADPLTTPEPYREGFSVLEPGFGVDIVTFNESWEGDRQVRAQELGTDVNNPPDRPPRMNQGRTGVRLEEQLGIQLEPFDQVQHPYKYGDWIAANGTTYDALTPVPGHFNWEQVRAQIDEHFTKQGVDYVVIDVTDISYEEAELVKNYVDNELPEADRQRTIRIGW